MIARQRRFRPIFYIASALALAIPPQLPAAAPAAPAQVLPLRAMATSRYSFGTSARYVSVPAGVAQIVVEQRQGSGWKPISVQHFPVGSRDRGVSTAKAKVVPITLPSGLPASQVRVLAYRGAKFPTATMRSQLFQRVEDQPSSFLPIYSGDTTAATGLVALPNLALNTVQASSVSALMPLVEESDIWKIAGNHLFFFNQYRGLQVFDITDPAAPVRTGGVRLPASGEEMYALGENGAAVALICHSTENARNSSLRVFDTKNGVPTPLSQVEFSGYVADSRLVGSTLYILVSANSLSNFLTIWWHGSNATLLTFDLSDPAQPQRLPDVELPGAACLQMAGRYLLVGTGQTYTSSRLYLLDTLTDTGTPALLKTYQTNGRILDKFKMNVVNGAVVAVTTNWSQTWVETFPLEGDSVELLALLELEGARNESLHATRFDGDRLYVVTFRRVDPLFVVDLTDPASPTLRAALEVPGWSTYIEPLGDRLLTVGIEGNQVAVSLFDVADATTPSLVSRLLLGGGYSSSEANQNEKAIAYYPETGLLMVPFQSSTQGIQMITVGHDSLTPGLMLPHDGVARRGALVGNHIISISGREMQVLDAAATSVQETIKISLAWTVDRVLPFGEDYLLQIEEGNSSVRAALRVSMRTDPDMLLEDISLGAGRIVGATERGGRLFLAQWLTSPNTGTIPKATTGNDLVESRGPLRTWILDISNPPAVTQVAEIDHDLGNIEEYEIDSTKLAGAWPSGDTLVWHLPKAEQRYFICCWPVIGVLPIIGSVRIVGGDLTVINAGLTIGTGTINILPGTGGSSNTGTNSVTVPNSGGERNLKPDRMINPRPWQPLASGAPTVAMLICPVIRADGAAAAGPVIRIEPSTEVRSASRAFAQSGFLLASFEEKISEEATTDGSLRYGYNPPSVTVRSWLQVLDFRGGAPIVRAPVSIPGELISVTSVDAQGAVLFTQSGSINNSGPRTVHAVAYDGVAAFQLDAKEVLSTIYNPLTAHGGDHLYFSRDASPGILGLAYDAVAGHLVDLPALDLTGYPSVLHVTGEYLLAGQYGRLETATIGSDGTPTLGTSFDTPNTLLLRVDQAVSTDSGLLFPAREHGVEFLPWDDLGE